MKIVLLSALSSIHTVRWANALSDNGHNVVVISASNHRLHDTLRDDIKVKYIPFNTPYTYIFGHFWLKRILGRIRPDIVNAHYASGYGMLARLSKYRPVVLSVWGADVYDFPAENIWKKRALINNITSANCVTSTSYVMSKQVKQVVGEPLNISVIPFGVDTEVFLNKKIKHNDEIVIGTVKYLHKKYGIDLLINAFSSLYKSLCSTNNELANRLRLRIVGDGEEMENLKKLANRLNISDKLTFVGAVQHHKIPCELNKLDIYVALSRMESESFGVAVIEASSCGLPVVVSNVGGLPEVVINNVTGIIVPKESADSAATALEKLIKEPSTIIRMGEAGRKHVKNKYEWSKCVDKMEKVYEKCRLVS